MFEPIAPRHSAVDACAAALEQAILSGELSPGTRLPPERRLAESFGVNRVTVRSALGRLAASGLLSVRQGSGHLVEDYRERGGPALVGLLAELAETGRDLAEVVGDLLLVRRQLAQAVLEKLVDSWRPEVVQQVEAAVVAFEDVVDSGPAQPVLVEADLAVLRSLLRATGSAVLQLCWNPVATVVSQLAPLRSAMYLDPASNVAGYRLLLEWLRAPSRDRIGGVIALLEARDKKTLAHVARWKRP